MKTEAKKRTAETGHLSGRLAVAAVLSLMTVILMAARMPDNLCSADRKNLAASDTLAVNAAGKFELFRKEGRYYFRLKAGNGQVILDSQSYKTRGACLKGIKSVQRNAPLDSRYERQGSGNRWSFTLKAPNGEIIGRSQDYTSDGAREKGIQSVKNNGITATVTDVVI